MAEDTILNLMVSHHALLEVLFKLFKDQANKKSEKASESLSELIWEIKKHFFTEENAIFDFLPMINYGVLETVNHLRDEHIEMLNDLKKFSENVLEISDEDLKRFSKLLENHRSTEEENLYPKLDKELREEKRKEVVFRINEIPIRTDQNK